jgi:hypothetical protein
MPGADDKVILRIKLETQGVSKELQALTKEIKALTTAMGGLTKTGTTGFTAQNKALKTGNEALKEQARLAREMHKHKTVVNREDNKQADLQKRRAREDIDNTKKAEGILRRFAQGFGKGSGLDRFGQRPEGGYAHRAGQLIGSAPRVVANTALSIGSGLLGFLMGGIQGAYGTHLQVGQAMAPLAGMGTFGGASRGRMQPALRSGIQLGYGPSATYGHAVGVGRATGDIYSVDRAQQFAMASGGMDVGEATGIMGALRSGGLRFGLGRQFQGKEGSAEYKADQAQDTLLRQRSSKELEKLMAAGMATGIEKTRLNQYMQNVAQAVGVAGTRTMGDVDMQSIQVGYGFLAKAGLTDPGRAQAAAQRLDQAIRAPGAGEAGQAMVMGAFGYGRPGGNVGWYEAEKRQEQGFLGKGGSKNMLDVFKFGIQQYAPLAAQGMKGDDPRLNFASKALQEMGTGDKAFNEAIMEKILAGEDDASILKSIEDEQKKNEPLAKQALDASKQGFSDVVKRLAGIEARNAGIGGQTAKLVEYFQDKQYELLKYLVSLIPDIIKILRDVAIHVKILVEGFRGATMNPMSWGKSFSDASTKVWKEEDQRRAKEAKKDVEREVAYQRSNPSKNVGQYLENEKRRAAFLARGEEAIPGGEEAKVRAEGAGRMFGKDIPSAEDLNQKRAKLQTELDRVFAAAKGKKGKKFKVGDLPLDDATQVALMDLEAAERGASDIPIGQARDALLDAYNRSTAGGRQRVPKRTARSGARGEMVPIAQPEMVPDPNAVPTARGGGSRWSGWADAPEDVRYAPRLPANIGGQAGGATGPGAIVPGTR